MEFLLQLRAFIVSPLICLLIAGCNGEPNTVGGEEVDNGGNPEASGTVSISYVSASASQITLSGQGGINSAVLTFRVVDESGDGLRGERVNFALNSTIGNASLLGETTAVETNSNGNVSVTLASGTVSTTVSVVATLDGTEKFAVSEGINISTGVPTASRFDIAAAPGWNAERTLTHNGIEVEISVYAGDSFGNNAFDGVGVSFWSPEMGTIEPSCILQGGQCSVTWISSGIRPDPRLVTIIAYASGAEDFVDENGNNLYDAGEPFTDLGEPYADENGNEVYDLGEFFVDFIDDDPDSEKGVWNPDGNGQWDGPCPDGATGCTADSSVVISTQGVLYLCPDSESYEAFPSLYHEECATAE